MSIFGKTAKNYMAVALVFILILVVYYTSSMVNGMIEEDPIECNDTSFTIAQVCYNPERINLNNFHSTVDIKVQNRQADINGFAIKFYSDQGIVPVMMFKTVKSGEEATISAPYEEDLSGGIKKIEIKPILNMNHNLYHCSIKHGMVYEEQVGSCL